MEDWENYRERILKVKDHRHHKIKNSYGVYDAYKYYRKNKPKDSKYIISESQYFAIIRNINNLLAEDLMSNKDIKLPARLGTLEIRKYNPNVSWKDGKLKIGMPIDWDQTLKLWYTDKEAYDNKTLVRHNVKEVFRIYYNKIDANYLNKSFYHFTLNREIKRKLKDKIKGKLIDAFILNN